ncbi:cation:proton antiporter, partial [Klebsiella pneumoniae]|uniref:cation:proton antiporter domain-containing protein n=1 Tax=Klebsiella pneumoniae TaxID=573 RepID=UPI001E619FEE
LFLDGWRIPKDAFFRDMKPILSLAIGLVMVTILGIGLFIHWLVQSAAPLNQYWDFFAHSMTTKTPAQGGASAANPLPTRNTLS